MTRSRDRSSIKTKNRMKRQRNQCKQWAASRRQEARTSSVESKKIDSVALQSTGWCRRPAGSASRACSRACAPRSRPGACAIGRATIRLAKTCRCAECQSQKDGARLHTGGRRQPGDQKNAGQAGTHELPHAEKLASCAMKPRGMHERHHRANSSDAAKQGSLDGEHAVALKVRDQVRGALQNVPAKQEQTRKLL